MKPRSLILALVFGVALAAGAFLALRMQQPAVPVSALVLPDPDPMPSFALLDQHGAAIDERVFRGQWDLVFFGFTHCPDICPATLQVLAAARRELATGKLTPNFRIVLVSVDPERDTPPIMGQYVDYFGDGNLGITGSLEEIRKLTQALGIYFEKQPADEDGNYNVDHSGAVLVIDPDGRFSALFGGPHLVENYVHDIPIIMAGQ
jgi:protein SCO1/2